MKKGKKQFQGPRPRQPERPSTPSVNLDFYNASVVHVRDFDSVQIVLAGCGGNGSHMARHLGGIIRVLYRQQAGVNLTICDPDIVKEENIDRQDFCDADKDKPKAVVLASRYARAWGVNTMAFVGEYHEGLLCGADLTVLVGCVDRPEGRRVLSETLRHNPEEPRPDELPSYWWLDLGNVRDAGRVLLGSAYAKDQLRGAFFVEKKRCISLPSPTLQYPTLLVPGREDLPDNDMSCAQLTAANLQSLNINPAVAVQAADMLTRLLITHDLRRYACVVNIESGVVKSDYVTPEQVARDIGRSENFVKADPLSLPTPPIGTPALEAAAV